MASLKKRSDSYQLQYYVHGTQTPPGDRYALRPSTGDSRLPTGSPAKRQRRRAVPAERGEPVHAEAAKGPRRDVADAGATTRSVTAGSSGGADRALTVQSSPVHHWRRESPAC